MRAVPHSKHAFTLVETMIGTVIFALLGGIVYTLLNLGMTLYAQNVSLGQTHSNGLEATEKLYLEIAAAEETPELTDDTGASLAGNGPSAGVRFYNLGSPLTYQVILPVSAAAYSITITKTGTQPQPLPGDKITMADLGFQGVITSITNVGGTHTLWFATPIGDGFVPSKFVGTVIPSGAKCFLLQPTAFISVGSVLRHYPRAMSVVEHGSSAFNNPANFVAISSLLPLASQTNAFPFQYLGTSRRSIDVNLRLRSPAFGGKVGDFYAYQNLKTTVAYRTSVIR